MRRALTTLALTAAATLVAVAPVQAGRFTPVATFTLDPNGTTLPALQVAADWSKGTNVLIRVGACSGARCIKLAEPDALTHCTTYSAVLGCGGFTLPDGSCGVEVLGLLTAYPDARRYTTAHEVGHCLSLGHLEDVRALMHPTTSLRPSIVGPTKTDKAALNARYPRT
jgi:hypothetical protein